MSAAAGGGVDVLAVMAASAARERLDDNGHHAVRMEKARAAVAELIAAARDKLDDPGYSALVTDAVDARLRAALSNIEGGKT